MTRHDSNRFPHHVGHLLVRGEEFVGRRLIGRDEGRELKGFGVDLPQKS